MSDTLKPAPGDRTDAILAVLGREQDAIFKATMKSPSTKLLLRLCAVTEARVFVKLHRAEIIRETFTLKRGGRQ
jgi:hypothetical protein